MLAAVECNVSEEAAEEEAVQAGDSEEAEPTCVAVMRRRPRELFAAFELQARWMKPGCAGHVGLACSARLTRAMSHCCLQVNR